MAERAAARAGAGLQRARRVAAAGLVGGFAAFAIVAGGAPTARASASSYSADASAAAVRISIRDPQIVPILGGGGFDVTTPSAQASGDSLGNGRSVASVVYPGDDLAGIGGLLGTAVPSSVPVNLNNLPPYPVTVIADENDPNPPGQSAPMFQLSATAAEGKASATANGGLPPTANVNVSSSRSSATVTPTDDGGVSATGQTQTALAVVPGVAGLGTITSTAVASRDATGQLTRSADFNVTGASIDGLPLQMDSGEIVIPVLGQKIELGKAIQTLPIFAPLRAQGVGITFIPAEQLSDGIISAGLEVSFRTKTAAVPLPSIPLPPTGLPITSIGALPPSTFTTVVSYGFASATADLAVIPGFTSQPPGSTSTLTSPAASASAGSSAAAPVTGTPQGGGLVSPPSVTTPELTGAGPAPAVAGQPTTVVAEQAYRRPASFDAADIYLAVAAAAVIAFATAHFLRYQGVRTRWTS